MQRPQSRPTPLSSHPTGGVPLQKVFNGLHMTTMQHGDDLDDDFVPDDLVALSDEEELPDAEDVGDLLSADEDAGEAQAGPSQSAAALEKKRKRRAKEKERKLKVCLMWLCRLLVFSSLPVSRSGN